MRRPCKQRRRGPRRPHTRSACSSGVQQRQALRARAPGLARSCATLASTLLPSVIRYFMMAVGGTAGAAAAAAGSLPVGTLIPWCSPGRATSCRPGTTGALACAAATVAAAGVALNRTSTVLGACLGAFLGGRVAGAGLLAAVVAGAVAAAAAAPLAGALAPPPVAPSGAASTSPAAAMRPAVHAETGHGRRLAGQGQARGAGRRCRGSWVLDGCRTLPAHPQLRMLVEASDSVCGTWPARGLAALPLLVANTLAEACNRAVDARIVICTGWRGSP